MRPFLLSALSAILLIFSYPLPNLEFLAWFAFVPLFFALENERPLARFLLGYIAGIVFFAGTIYWLVNVTLAGLIILVLYLALYFGMFALFIKRSTVLIPAVWITLEFVRSNLFTGFGWNLLAYSQSYNLIMIQIADVVGAYGVSFVVMMINVAVYQLVASHQPAPRELEGSPVTRGALAIRNLLLPVLIVALCLVYGYFKLSERPRSYVTPLRIAVVQGNIPQEIKWDEAAQGLIMEKYDRLTRLSALDEPDLIIWPETSVPGYINLEAKLKDEISALAKDINIPLLVGAPWSEERLNYNSALLVSEKGEFLTRHDKIHLVPFGEFVPFARDLPFLRDLIQIGDFTSGKRYTIFQTAPMADGGRIPPFGVLVCFEDIFPALVKNFVKSGAQFLVVITNDAWFGKTAAPYQHAQASVFRAVENRVNIVRAANTGLSCFIEPTGRITDFVSDADGELIFVTGYKTRTLNIKKLQR